MLGIDLISGAVRRAMLGKPAASAAAPGGIARDEQIDGGPAGGLQHPAVRYEHSDASFRWILGIIMGAVLFAAIILFAILRVFYDYRDYEASIKRSNYPLAPAQAESLPPQPRLEQVNRMAGIERGNVYLREAEKEAVLHSYGSAGDGYVHIPIDGAMDYLADKLRARKGRSTAEQARRQNGLVGDGASNSGRKFRGSGHE
jgi:hypothetical protein